MNIAPLSSMINAVREQNLPWFTVLGELIDNAFDANARRVSISFEGDKLEITDDGIGCPDLGRMLRMGDRQGTKHTKLGRFGIGGKDAFITIADTIRILSVSAGVKRQLYANWKVVEKTGWDIEDPEESPTEQPDGTLIVLHPIRRNKPHFENLRNDIAFYYSSAIRSGRQIIFKATKEESTPIKEWAPPPLEHQITADLDVEGKKARVTIGLYPKGHIARYTGTIISYEFRVILKDKRIGLGDKPTPGLLALVELGEGWQLTKNKDNISSNLEPLGDAIFAACRPTIEKAWKRSELVVFDKVSADLNRILEELESQTKSKKRKAKRNPSYNRGTIIPVGTSAEHRQASQTQEGARFDDPAQDKGLQVAFDSLGSDGPASRYQDNIIYLNRDIPILSDAAKDEKALACHAIYAIATYQAMKKSSSWLPIMRDAQDDFARMTNIAGHLLAKWQSRLTLVAEAQ